MKRIVKLLLWIAGAYLILVLGSGLAIKAMLSGGRIRSVLQTVNARSPVAVSVAEGSFDLAAWFRFQPVITLTKISVANPPGFSAEPMLTAQEAGAQLALLSLFGDTIRVRDVSLREPNLSIETNTQGNTNVAALFAAKPGREADPSVAPQAGGGKAVSIENFSLEDGTVRYKGRGSASGLTVRDIDLAVSGFGAGRSSEFTLSARLFGGKSSRLDFKGQAGPATPATVPAQGTLSVMLVPLEIPQPIRVEYFGDLLRDPPPAANVSLSAAMKGDLMKTLAGSGELQFDGFAIGRSQQTRLGLNGKAPFRLSANSVLGDPSFDLSSPNASLQLGQGRWKGSLVARYDGTRIHGDSRGSITGVRIEEILRALSTAKDPVSGLAEVPEYRIEFAGRNAAEIQKNLTGDGRIAVKDGKVALFDLLGTIEARIKSALAMESGKAGATDFVTLSSRFNINNGQVSLADIVLQNASANISGQGALDFNHAMNFELAAVMSRGPVANLRVPVRVRGTLESPKVYPDVAGMAKATAVEKGKGLLDSFLKKRLGKQPQ